MTNSGDKKTGSALRLRLCAAMLAAWCIGVGAGESAPAPAAPSRSSEEVVFARVGERTVSMRDYENLLAATMRQKFYHGKVPEGQAEVVGREVGNMLIDRALLLEEAKRRGVTADSDQVRRTLEGYETRYGASPMWKQNRERLLPGLIAQLEQQSVLERMESAARKVLDPAPEDVKSYYTRSPEKFTEPEKFKLSIILLRVAPSAPKESWDKAREEAKGIHQRLIQGADFGELAKLHSADESGQRGGSLGYLHRGMLPEALQGEVDKFKEGVVAQPMTLLEGVAIFRLDERVPGKLRAFEEVQQRAADLLRRERSDAAWKDLIASLRARTQVRIEAPGFATQDAPGK